MKLPSARGWGTRGALAFTFTAALAARAVAQGVPVLLVQFLGGTVGLNQSQLAAVERGEAVVKSVNTKNKRDVAVFGIVAVDVSREVYIRRLLDFRTSLRRPTQTQFGLFSTPAGTEDVQSLTLDRKDVADARNCKPRDCVFKLPATAMRRLQQVIDWSIPDPAAQVDAYMRRRLVEYVNDYRARGDSAMVVYDDQATVRASDAFTALLRQSPYVHQESPALYRYLTGYPRDTLDATHEVFFWSVDTLQGLQPILTVNQLVVYAPPGHSFALTAEKQIYANHYFEAGFDFLAVVDRVSARGPSGIYLIRLERSRFDEMPSVPLVNVRGKVAGKSRDKMKAELQREKAGAEALVKQS